MCIVEQQKKNKEKEINTREKLQNNAFDERKSYQESLSYDAKAREFTNQLIDKVNGVALSREAQQYYGTLLKEEAANYEELQQPAQEDLLAAQADQETKQQRKEKARQEEKRVRQEEKYHSNRKVYGDGVGIRTQVMLDERAEFKGKERKEINGIYNKLSEKKKLEYLIDNINVSDFSADMFEPKPGFVKEILKCLDKLNKFATLRRLTTVQDPKDEFTIAVQKAFGELDKPQKEKVDKIVALYNAFVPAAYSVLGENAINWKGKLDVELARKDSKVENRRLVEFEKKIDATRHSQETEEALSKFYEELSSQQKVESEENAHKLTAEDSASLGDNVVACSAEVQKKYDESIRYFKNKAGALKDGGDKEACLNEISTELEHLMKMQMQMDFNIEGISRTIADLEAQKKQNLTTKSKHNPDKYTIDADLAERLKTLKDHQGYISGSVDYFMRNKRIARLQRMVRGICDGRPMTMSMRLELADKYHLKEYELKLQETEESNRAKYHFDNRDYADHADLKINNFTVDEALEKQADHMEHMMGEMSMEEFKEAKGKAYVKKYFRTFAYMESEKYLVRKQNQRKFAQFLQKNFASQKGSISLHNDDQEINKRAAKLKKKNQLARLYGIKEKETNGQVVQGTVDTIQTVMDVGVAITDVSLGVATLVSNVADTTQQFITDIEYMVSGPLTVLTCFQTAVKSLNAFFESGKYSYNAGKEVQKLQESIDAFKAGKVQFNAEELKQIEGLRRLLLMMKNAVTLGKVDAVKNLAKSIKSACSVASNTLGTLLIAANALAKTSVHVVCMGVDVAAEHGKKALRKTYVKNRFEEMFRAVEDKNTAMEAGFDGLSKHDIKHGLLRFLGAKTGKFSEAHALTAKTDADFLQDLEGDKELKDSKKEVLKVMGLTENSKVEQVMLKLGANDGAAQDVTAYVHKYRVLDASRKETARQSRFKTFVRKTIKFMTCGDGNLNNTVGGIFSSNSHSDFWYDFKSSIF